MRKSYISAAAIASAALLLAACGGGGSGESTADATTPSDTETTAEATEPEGGEETTEAPAVRGEGDLVIWADSGKAEAVQAVADAYGAANGITVNVQTVANVRSDFVTANQAGNGPDMIVGAHDWIGQLVANGAIDPLVIGADSIAAYHENAIEATTFDGQQYALPYGMEALVLYCNNEYAPGPFDTLDAAIAAGQAAKDAGQVQSALNVPVGVTGDAYHMQPLFTSAGGYLFGYADGVWDPNDLGIATEGGLAAGQKIYDLGEAGQGVLSTAIDGSNSIALFTEGSAACLISGPWALNDIRAALGDDGFNMQPIPGFEGMNPAQPFLGVNAFYVASNGANKAFAQDFVASTAAGGLNTPDAMRTLFEISAQPPAMTAIADEARAADPAMVTFLDAATNAQPMPAIPAMDAIWAPMGQAWSAIVGGADPTETLTTAVSTIAAAIASS